MTKTLDQKKRVVENITAQLKEASAFYLADFKGLDADQITEIRSNFRAKGVVMQVAKNTLIKRALESLKITHLDEYLVGQISLIIADDEDPIAPAKVIVDFHKNNKDLFPVKSIQIDDSFFPGDQIKTVSKMPGKRELQTQIISLALGTGSNLVGILKGPSGKIMGQIESLISNLESKS